MTITIYTYYTLFNVIDMTDWKPDVDYITNNYTRKEMNEKALELGVDEPEGYPNKDELAERMIPLLKETEEEPEPASEPKEKKMSYPHSLSL